MPKQRTTLLYNGYPIRAAGLILYRITGSGQLEFLLQRRPGTGEWEDLGGKVEEQDKTVHHTMAREAAEESRGVLCMRELLLRLETAVYPTFVSESKYIFTLLPATKKESEQAWSAQEWVPAHALTRENVFVRLRHPAFLGTITK
jgi:8-oxo-dGTP pyrophosphatase MutT (NUDIX family)